MADIYTSGVYARDHPTWHSEDSQWKAANVARMIDTHDLKPGSIIEVGCGAGVTLSELARRCPHTVCEGCDISPQAIDMAQPRAHSTLTFRVADIADIDKRYDLLIALDVFEHVPDYLGFLHRCSGLADRHIYHIPLDVSVQHVMRGAIHFNRPNTGHLHYFTAETAVATLEDTGHRVVAAFFTNAAAIYQGPAGTKHTVGNLLRKPAEKLSPRWAARLLGGYSLMVLCERKQ